MEKRSPVLFILTIAFLLILSGVTYWQFKKGAEELGKVKMPDIKLEIPKTDSLFGETGNKEEKTFVSEDGKLELKYPSEWIEMEGLKMLNPELIKKEAKILLFLQKISLTELTPTFLIVQELGEIKNLAELIEEMKRGAKENETKMEIVKSEESPNQTDLEIEYQKKEGYNLRARQRIIFLPDKTYLIIFATLEENWERFVPEANSIFDSIKINL